MRTRWITVVATGLLAVGAGIAIAGMPTSAPDALVIAPGSATITTTTTTMLPPATTDAAGATTTGPDASPTTSVADMIDTVPDTIDTIDTVPDTTTTTIPLVDRGDLVVGVANAAGLSGLARRTVDELRPLGYVEIFPIDAARSAEFSTVFHAPGLDAEAARLARDAGLPADAIAPIDEAPGTTGTGEFQLLLVVGLDRV